MVQVSGITQMNERKKYDRQKNKKSVSSPGDSQSAYSLQPIQQKQKKRKKWMLKQH